MPRGGSRPGSGRRPKDRTPDGQIFETAEDYLTAVVQGRIAPDPARIAAARTLICYQQSKIRRPKPAPAPKDLDRKAHLAEEEAINKDFEEKAAAIREKHTKEAQKCEKL